MDFFHRREQCGGCKSTRRTGALLLGGSLLKISRIAHFHRRQQPLILVFFLLGLSVVKLLPAKFTNDPPPGCKLLSRVANSDAGLAIGMHRKELGDISLRDEKIQVPLGFAQVFLIVFFHRGNNRMMGRDLFIIPGPAAYVHISPSGPARKITHSSAAQIPQDDGGIIPL